LGNRVQHALRAFTAKDRKDLDKAAQTYRDNPRFATADAIREVGTGEAVTSMLDRKGVPMMVERTLIRPPASQMGPLDAGLRAAVIAGSPMGAKYGTRVDRESAHEMLAKRAAEAAGAAEAEAATPDDGFNKGRRYDGGRAGREAPAPAPKGRPRQQKGFGEALTEAAVKELSGTTGRRIVRGILGGMFRGR
jgi:DNA helicase HerA-like ATPase